MELENVNLYDLIPSQLRELIEKIKEALVTVENSKNTTSKVVCYTKENCVCPFCCSNQIVKNGKTKNKIQTYKCKDCNRRFNDLTGTLFAHSKLNMQQIELYFQCLNNNSTLRDIAEILNINLKTAFLYRHKILDILTNINAKTKLNGQIEADEYYTSINLKGTKKDMPRASKPRKSHGGSKRGISNHQVCVASAIDEKDNIYLSIVGTGPITTEEVKTAFKSRIDSSAILITDCKSSYEKFAKFQKIKLEQIKSGTYVNSNGYSLGNINSLHSNLEQFLSKFRGVSTKHLNGYLSWFAFSKLLKYTSELLERSKKFMDTTIIQKTFITVNNIYDNTSNIDFFKVYAEYNYHA